MKEDKEIKCRFCGVKTGWAWHFCSICIESWNDLFFPINVGELERPAVLNLNFIKTFYTFPRRPNWCVVCSGNFGVFRGDKVCEWCSVSLGSLPTKYIGGEDEVESLLRTTIRLSKIMRLVQYYG